MLGRLQLSPLADPFMDPLLCATTKALEATDSSHSGSIQYDTWGKPLSSTGSDSDENNINLANTPKSYASPTKKRKFEDLSVDVPHALKTPPSIRKTRGVRSPAAASPTVRAPLSPIQKGGRKTPERGSPVRRLDLGHSSPSKLALHRSPVKVLTVPERALDLFLKAHGNDRGQFERETQVDFEYLAVIINDVWTAFQSIIPEPSQFEDEIQNPTNNQQFFISIKERKFSVYLIDAENPVAVTNLSFVYKIHDLMKKNIEILKIQPKALFDKEFRNLRIISPDGNSASFMEWPREIRIRVEPTTQDVVSWSIVKQYPGDLFSLAAETEVLHSDPFQINFNQVQVVLEILVMLKKLYDAEMLQGDIKLENIFVEGGTEFRLKMADFGGSCLFNKLGEDPDKLKGFSYFYHQDIELLGASDEVVSLFNSSVRMRTLTNLQDFIASLAPLNLPQEFFSFAAFSKRTPDEFIASLIEETNLLKHSIDIFAAGVTLCQIYMHADPYERYPSHSHLRGFRRDVGFVEDYLLENHTIIPGLSTVFKAMADFEWRNRPTAMQTISYVSEAIKNYIAALGESDPTSVGLKEVAMKLGQEYVDLFVA